MSRRKRSRTAAVSEDAWRSGIGVSVAWQWRQTSGGSAVASSQAVRSQFGQYRYATRRAGTHGGRFRNEILAQRLTRTRTRAGGASTVPSAAVARL